MKKSGPKTKKKKTDRELIEEVEFDIEERKMMQRENFRCNCDLSSPDYNPLLATCYRHGPYRYRYAPNQECPEEYYEKMEKKKAEEYKKATETHEKRMEYLRTEGLKYLEETEWMYKPIEHYLK